MPINITETIQKNLGYPPLKKIDPNIQETNAKDEGTVSAMEKLAQAAIPSVLTGIYAYARDDNRRKRFFSDSKASDWLDIIFDGNEEAAVDKVSRYAEVSLEEAEMNMRKIAAEASTIIQSALGNSTDPDAVKAVMKDERHNILVYLPATMQVGDLLNNDSLDDRTNKMEGPISNLMHKIEDKLSGGNEPNKYP